MKKNFINQFFFPFFLLCVLIVTNLIFTFKKYHLKPSIREKISNKGELIFPLSKEHCHASSLIQLKNKNLLATWFQGSGEKRADDTKIMGAFYLEKEKKWTKPQILADTKGFPDINPVIAIDKKNKLYLFWFTVLGNQWYSSLIKYKVSSNYSSKKIVWQKEKNLLIKFDNTSNGIKKNDVFVNSLEESLKTYTTYLIGKQKNKFEKLSYRLISHLYSFYILNMAKANIMPRFEFGRSSFKNSSKTSLFRRLSWQTRGKPLFLDNGKIILPLYSDLFNCSVFALSDNGEDWRFTKVLSAFSNLQPTMVENGDTIISLMRNNALPKQAYISYSYDKGENWTPVKLTDLPNPNSSLSINKVQEDILIIACNYAKKGRFNLSLVLVDIKKNIAYEKLIESSINQKEMFSYPSIITDKEQIFLTYSYTDRSQGKESIKFFTTNISEIKSGRKIKNPL